MRTLFLNLVNASFYGSIVIAAVLGLRLVLKKAPKSVVCLLWLLALARLVLPFEIESRFSLQPEMAPVAQLQQELPGQELPGEQTVLQEQTQTHPSQVPAVPDTDELPEDVVIEYNDNAVTDHHQVVVDYAEIAAWVWAAGTAALWVCSAVSYRKLKKQVAAAKRQKDGWLEAEGIQTAFVLGIRKPEIYLPAGLSQEEKRLILAHEKTHIARRDHWFKPVGYLVLTLHWFNPLVWLAYMCLCRDIEMACDEQVVKSMDMGERKAYSHALLSCSSRQFHIAACPVAFGEVPVKQRILGVLNYRKPGFWITAAALAAVVVVMVCFLTNPVESGLLRFADISSGEIQSVTLWGQRVTTLSTQEELEETARVLEEVRVNPRSVSSITSREIGYNSLIVRYGENTKYFLFSKDFSDLALWDGEDTSLLPVYTVENPEVLRDFFEFVCDGMRDRTVTAKPFAGVNDVWAWVRGISVEAVERAEYYSFAYSEATATGGGGVFTAWRFGKLADILNDLPRNGIISQRHLENTTGYYLQNQAAGRQDGVSLTILDGANGLVAVLRLTKDDTVELVLCEEPEKLMAGNLGVSAECWELNNGKLTAFMLELMEHGSSVIYQKDRWVDNLKWNGDNSFGILLSAENVTSTGMTLVCEQSGVAGEITTGEAYTLYEKWGETYVEVPVLRDEVVWNEIAWIVNSDGETRWEIDWEWLYGQLPPGEYLLRKEFRKEYQEQWQLYAAFTIEETAPELTQCRAALREVKNADALHILEVHDFSGSQAPLGNLNRNYFRYGDAWMSIDNLDVDAPDTYYACMSLRGRLYEGMAADDLVFSWEEQTGSLTIREPWLSTFDPAGAEMQLVDRVETGNGCRIRVMIYEPYDSGYTAVESYYADLHFNDADELTSVTVYLSDVSLEEEIHIGIVYLPAEDVLSSLRQYAGNLEQELDSYLGNATWVPTVEDAAVRRCREALESFQTQTTYCLMIERQMSGDILNNNATQLYYVNGLDWLQHCVINETDFVQEDWYLEKDGRQFTKYTTHHHHEGNGVDINTGWEEGPREESGIVQPWLRTFDWDAQKIEFVDFVTDGTHDTVTILVSGKPSDAGDNVEVAEYTVDFVFNTGSRTLHQVILRYTETWAMVSDGEETTGVGHMVATMDPNAAGEDMILQMLDAMYTQAITN